MTLDEYQRLAARTLTGEFGKPTRDMLSCVGLGLAGEAGEVVDHIKKHLHHGHDLDRAKLVKEAGDLLWYVAALATLLGEDMSEVARQNVAKLERRYPDGFSHEASRNRSDDP